MGFCFFRFSTCPAYNKDLSMYMSDVQVIDLFRKNFCSKYCFDSINSQFKYYYKYLYRYTCVHINTRAILFQNHEVYNAMLYFFTSNFLQIKEYLETEIYLFDIHSYS